MKQSPRPTRRISTDESDWHSLGEIALPVGFDPQQRNIPELDSVVRALNLSDSRQRQIERAVCDALVNSLETLGKSGMGSFLTIRVFAQGYQPPDSFSLVQNTEHSGELRSSWGFFLISNLETETNTMDNRRTIDLFLYPEG